jgi:hypothetical protein
MGCMGAEDPSSVFPGAPLSVEVERHPE